METKKHIRKEIFARRRAASDQEVAENSRAIFQKISQFPEYRNASWIYAYMDYNHEVMTREFILQAWKEGKKVAVPKVSGKEMVFYRLDDFSQLEEGYYGIQEPKPDPRRQAGEEPGMILVPGVAFDRQRHRIGYGGGFYDRYLSVHPQHVSVAAAFEFQLMEGIPVEDTDICPDILVTEKNIFR